MNHEFLFRLPGSRHLLALAELEREIDNRIIEMVGADFDAMDEAMIQSAIDIRTGIERSLKVEVYDSKILRSDKKDNAVVGTMTVSAVHEKFT